jgi:CRP-like cAMP-binding protein
MGVAIPLDRGDLALPPGTEVARLLASHPDIMAERFADEELLIRSGENDDDIFMLLQGACLVEQPDAPERRRAGDAVAVLEAAPDAPVFVGEMAYLGRHPRSAGVRSVMAVTALRMKPAHLDAIITGYPGLTRILCRQFAERLRETNQHLHALRSRMALHPEALHLECGESLFTAGEPATRLYQLVEGALECGKGHAWCRIAQTPGTPCFLEARAFLARSTWPVSARAQTRCVVLVHGEKSRAALVRNYPELVLEFLA